MVRSTLRLVPFLVVALGAIAFVGVPALERHFTFQPRRADPARPWTSPSGAEDVFFDSAPGVRLHGWY